jgi:hypothetical protein
VPERVLHLTKDIVLPLGVVLTLATFSYQFGGWKTDKDIKVEQALALARATAETAAATIRRLDGLDVKIGAVEREVSRIDRNQERLTNFTKGRIARLPWRASDAQ